MVMFLNTRFLNSVFPRAFPQGRGVIRPDWLYEDARMRSSPFARPSGNRLRYPSADCPWLCRHPQEGQEPLGAVEVESRPRQQGLQVFSNQGSS